MFGLDLLDAVGMEDVVEGDPVQVALAEAQVMLSAEKRRNKEINFNAKERQSTADFSKYEQPKIIH